MGSGRYTAYHVYQDLSFSEAEKAGTQPYRMSAYQCPHSQRGYLFQFANMTERTHFDAAVTTCCDQPVMNFANKPQYAEAAKPMNPVKCSERVETGGCELVEVEAEGRSSFCADESDIIRRVRVRCPSQCPDLAGVGEGGTLEGAYGTFRMIGVEAGEEMVLDYAPDPSVLSAWYNGCSGVGTIREYFCGGHTLAVRLKADIDYPDGCGCDCCGEHGVNPPPVMTISAPASLSADWSEIVGINQTISGDEACSGGALTGTFHASGGGAAGVDWSGPTQYQTAGGGRYVTRDAVSVGSPSAAGCCGGHIEWSGSDGCGGGAVASTTVHSPVTDIEIIPSSGTVLYESGAGSFSGLGACAASSSASMSVSGDCLVDSGSGIIEFDSFIRALLSGSLTFDSGDQCGSCCGSGSVYVSFNNGCGVELEAAYDVRRPYGVDPLVGYLFRCEDYNQSYFKVARADLSCDGTIGAFTQPSSNYYSTLEDCTANISGTSARDISGSPGCGGSLPGSSLCCFYSDNGLSGYEFRSRVYAVSGLTCCAIDLGVSGGWVNSGSGALCCPVRS